MRSFESFVLNRTPAIELAGNVGMMMFPILIGVTPVTLETVIIAGVVTLMAASSAAGSLALARRADPLLESGEGVGLLEGELPDPS